MMSYKLIVVLTFALTSLQETSCMPSSSTNGTLKIDPTPSSNGTQPSSSSNGTLKIDPTPLFNVTRKIGPDLVTDSGCQELPQHLATYCGYNHTFLPNPKGHVTVKEVLAEFNSFSALLSRGCSPYLGTFLCFYYFPFSSCEFDPKSKKKVLPCHETCEAAKTQECTNYIQTALDTWPAHLSCSLPIFLAKSSNMCAHGINTRVFTPRATDSGCQELPQHLATYCGYNHTFFPNPKGHVTVKEALAEFSDFSLLLSRRCSLYLGTFLCYYYFPFSSCGFDPKSEKQVLPCHETCEAAKTQECTNYIQTALDTWPAHLNCSLPDFPAKSSKMCAYGSNARGFTSTNVIAESTTASPSPETSTTEVTTTPVKCPRKCLIRENLKRKLFQNNPHYTYAAQVSVLHKFMSTGRHAYEVQVHMAYGIQTCNKAYSMETAPPMGNRTVIYTNYAHCDMHPDLSNRVRSSTRLFIAGAHSVGLDGVMFSLDCENGKPFVSDWKKKYSKKDFVTTAVDRGNQDRKAKCKKD